MRNAAGWALTLVAAASLCACATAREPAADPGSNPATPDGTPPIQATIVEGPAPADPLIGMNRAFFAFNDVTYRFLLIPIAKGYRWVMPDPVETGIGNFFHNLKTPIYVVNDVLQFEPRPLGRHLSRFVINSTIGLLGFFDPAAAWFGLEKKGTGFNDTLNTWGIGQGVYLVLPILGPSDTRRGVGMVADHLLNPLPYITNEPQTTGIQVTTGVNQFAPYGEKYDVLRARLDDPYVFFRNLYMQGSAQRNAAY